MGSGFGEVLFLPSSSIRGDIICGEVICGDNVIPYLAIGAIETSDWSVVADDERE